MNRRVVGAVASVLLALLGTFVLVSFVRGAEERALAGKELVQAILIDGEAPVPAGTPADRIPLRVVRIPAETVASNPVTDALELFDMVTAVELVPGEQLIWSRLINAEAFEAIEASKVGPTDLPLGYMEITIPIPAVRALGGRIEVGEVVSLVGIFAGAYEPGFVDPNAELGQVTADDTVEFVAPPPSQSTHILANGVLVTGLQIDQPLPPPALPVVREDDDVEIEEPDVTQAPDGTFLISLALRAYDIERVVFAQEYGSLWMAREPVGADLSGSQVQTLESIYERIELPLDLSGVPPELLAMVEEAEAAAAAQEVQDLLDAQNVLGTSDASDSGSVVAADADSVAGSGADATGRSAPNGDSG